MKIVALSVTDLGLMAIAVTLFGLLVTPRINNYFAEKRDERNRIENDKAAKTARTEEARKAFLAILNPIIRDMEECRHDPDERWRKSKATLQTVYENLRLRFTADQLARLDSAFRRYCDIPGEQREPETPQRKLGESGVRKDYSKVIALMLGLLRELERIVSES